MNSLISKARKPKFELNLKIIDLNNVPLVSGTSFIKWHLPSSTSAEHRGRTHKEHIKEHKVVWDYEKVLPVRLTMDKANMLQECMIDFEIVQDYSSGGRGEKITLGHVSVNLSEYVEMQGEDGEEGVTRRFLMQDSKINSTLKIGISMKQLDGERNFVAPPLKTAPVFGGIAGIMAGDQGDQDDLGNLPAMNKSREAGELQDMYRRSLAASWAAQAGELTADKCIEDIFAGGNGWKTSESQDKVLRPRNNLIPGSHQSDEEENTQNFRNRSHRRTVSGSSSKSSSTVVGKGAGTDTSHRQSKRRDSSEMRSHKRGALNRGIIEHHHHGSSSEGSDRNGRHGFKHAHEVNEFDCRVDLIAWSLPSTAT